MCSCAHCQRSVCWLPPGLGGGRIERVGALRAKLHVHAVSMLISFVIVMALFARLQEGLATGNGDGRAGYVARKRIGQHDVSRGQLDRLAGALHRDLFAEIFDGILGQGRGNERCPDRSRGDRVGANALFGQHLRQTRREIMNRALGRCIGKPRRVGCIQLIEAVLIMQLPGFMWATAALVR